MTTTKTRKKKSDATREKIVATALKLFKARGYERTTMSLIAARAGVSKGNAYYYFASKEELIQSFYDELQQKHAAAAAARIAVASSFEERVRAAFLSWQEVAAPYHAYADKMFKNAASPTSPLSPFSTESRPARDASMKLFATCTDGLGTDRSERAQRVNVRNEENGFDADTRNALTTALWLTHTALVLFWIFDRSDGQEASKALAEKTAATLAQVMELFASPFLEGMRGQAVSMVADIARGLRIAE